MANITTELQNHINQMMCDFKQQADWLLFKIAYVSQEISEPERHNCTINPVSQPIPLTAFGVEAKHVEIEGEHEIVLEIIGDLILSLGSLRVNRYGPALNGWLGVEVSYIEERKCDD